MYILFFGFLLEMNVGKICIIPIESIGNTFKISQRIDKYPKIEISSFNGDEPLFHRSLMNKVGFLGQKATKVLRKRILFIRNRRQSSRSFRFS